MKVLLVILICAATFADTYIKTNKFRIKTSRDFSRASRPEFCKFETVINHQLNQLVIKAGVVGSPVDYFGWNMPINIQDLPLVEGFSKEYRSSSATDMLMSYQDGLLSFTQLGDEQVWSRVYKFSIEIDPALTKPKLFKASLEGFEITRSGKLKKHITQRCRF